MTYIDNLERESTTIYLTDKIHKNDQLMIFALYHSFYNYIAYSLENSLFANLLHKILKEKLTEYCNTISEEMKLNCSEFIVGYLDLLKDTILDDYSYCFQAELNSIIRELKWVNDIDKKSLSFDTKTKIVMIINNIINKTNYEYENIVDEENINKIKKEYKDRIIDYSLNAVVENYSINKYIDSLKLITKNFIKEKLKNNEINFNNIKDEELNTMFNYFNEEERKILAFMMVNIISDIPVVSLDGDTLLKEMSEELGKSKIKTKIMIYKFMIKWTKYVKKINQEVINDRNKTLKKLLIKEKFIKNNNLY